MGVSWVFAAAPVAPAATAGESVADRLLRGADPSEALGFGLLRPFRRDLKRDFANGGGDALVASKVGQVLGTRARSGRGSGEVRWRPSFGSWLHILRFMNNDAVLQEIARVYVVRALAIWVPVVRIREVKVTRDKGPSGTYQVASIRLRYGVATGPKSSQLAVEDVEQIVQV